MSDLSQLREYTLSIDEFKKPKVYIGNNAIVAKLIEIALLDPGTYPTRPDMGLGLRTKYRYISEDEITTLEQDYRKQIETYLPELTAVNVEIELDTDKVLHFLISVDKTVYTLLYNTETKTLDSL